MKLVKRSRTSQHTRRTRSPGLKRRVKRTVRFTWRSRPGRRGQRPQSFFQFAGRNGPHQGTGQAGHGRRRPGIKFPTVYLPQGVLQKGHHGLKAGGE